MRGRRIGRFLDRLPVGESGIVERITTSGPLRHRLIDMGLTPGVVVTIRRAAPLGDPIVVRLRGYELSIRRAEAHTIEVRREEEA